MQATSTDRYTCDNMVAAKLGSLASLFCLKLSTSKYVFTVRIHTENQNQVSFCPFAPREVSVLAELTLGHLRYLLTDVPTSQNIHQVATYGTTL